MTKTVISLLTLATLFTGSGCIILGNRAVEDKGTIGQQLIDLNKAKESGIITEAEFQEQKAKLLRGK